MTKYLLRFNKRDNMRFLSHLDLGRLFKRAIKRADIDVNFSEGFNPHEKINIVHPLSLGFESDGEYFEITTNTNYDVDELLGLMNIGMPHGLSFYTGRVVDEKNNYSNLSDASLYDVRIVMTASEYGLIDLNSFLNQDEIIVKKRDKKTKKYIEKNVKSFVYRIDDKGYKDDVLNLSLLLRTAPNETLNPINLVNALLLYFDLSHCEEVKITRKDILANRNGQYVSLFEV